MVHLRIHDTALRERVVRAIGALAELTENVDEADIVATDGAVQAPCIVISTARVAPSAFPEALRDAVASLQRSFLRRSSNARALVEAAIHEIRNPLNSVTVNLGFALSLAENDAAAHEALTDASQAATRVVRQLDDVAFLHRAEAGAIVASSKEIGVSELLDPVVDIVRATGRGRQMTIEAAPSDVPLFGDRALLARGLVALADLGLKYGVRGATLEVGVAREDRVIAFVRHDARKAIDHAPLAAWLDGKRRSGEIGFSLAVAAAVARAHRAELRVRSTERWPTEMGIALPE
jgi:signal transduction histidine kinase